MTSKSVFRRGLIILLSLCLIPIGFASASITTPEDITVIEEQAFYGDTSITEVNLPEGVTRIEKQAFAYTSLSSVLLPNSLEYFAQDTFEGCPDEMEIWVYPGSQAQELCELYQIQYQIKNTPRIGISLPTDSLDRWVRDGEKMKDALCDMGYEVDLRYAQNTVSIQVEQIEGMIDNGCQVLIITVVDGRSLTNVLQKAAERSIPVIAYERMIDYSDAVSYFIGFSFYNAGKIQGQYIEDKLSLKTAGRTFNLEIMAGSPDDYAAYLFYDGAMDVLQPYINSGTLAVKSGEIDFDTASILGWSIYDAQERAENILTAYYSDGTEIDAWLCPNDSIAMGVIYALDDVLYDGTWPVITGQDCDRRNVYEIARGRQSMSVFRDTQLLVERAARMVDQIMNNQTVDVNDNYTYHNYVKFVPAYLCSPIYVDINNYVEILIDSGYYTEEDINFD